MGLGLERRLDLGLGLGLGLELGSLSHTHLDLEQGVAGHQGRQLKAAVEVRVERILLHVPA